MAPKPITLTSVRGLPDLFTTDLLNAVGVKVNTELKLFICCDSVFTIKGLKEHQGRPTRHPGHVSALLTAHFKLVGELVGVAAEKLRTFTSTSGGCSPYSGLTTHDNMDGCGDCGYTAKFDSVKRHVAKGSQFCPGAAILHGLCGQVLCAGNSKTYIRVTHSLSSAVQPTAGDPVSALKGLDWQTVAQKAYPPGPQITPWLRHTRWHCHGLQPKAREIVEFMAFPDPKGPHGHIITNSRIYFKKATDLLLNTPKLVRQILNSADPDKNGHNNTPLDFFLNHEDTMAKYVNDIIVFLSSLLRPTDLFTYPTSPALQDALALIETEGGLHRVFRALWLVEWKESEADPNPDPSMWFLMLHALHAGGDFKTAKQSSRGITHLGWAIRFVALVELHEMVNRGECSDHSESVELVKPFVQEKRYTTFAAAKSMGHYAAAAAFGSPSLPLVWWTDRVHWSALQYKGNNVSLSQLTAAFTAMEIKLKELWEDKILLGTGLRVDYGELKDDLQNANPGFCFLDDLRNPFSAHTHDLLDAIGSTERLHQTFFRDGDLDGQAARAWLSDLADFEQLLMLAVEMCSGAPPRGPEIANSMIRNTPHRLRNVAGLGKFVALIRQYTKTTAISGADSLIPHGLNGFTADLVIQLHTLARPVARLFAVRYMPDFTDAVFNYAHLLFAGFGREFVTKDLSKLMASEMYPHLQWEMMVAAHRHVNIVFRRQTLGIREQAEESVISQVSAKQSGHERQTENQGYGLTSDALFGAPEHAVHAFIQESVAYHKMLKLVPGGLGLTYTQSMAAQFELHSGHQEPLPDHGSLPVQHFDMQPIVKMLAQQTSISTLMSTLAKIETVLTHDMKRRLGDTPPVQESAEQDSFPASPQQWGEDLPVYQAPVHTPIAPVLPSPVQTVDPPDIIDISMDDSDDDAEDISSAISIPTDEQLLIALRRLEGSNANWRSPEQLAAIRTVMQLTGDVIVTLPTCAGKSHVGIIPSMFEQGMTVFVAPSKALEADMKRKLGRLGLRFAHFEGVDGPAMTLGTKLVLTTSDKIQYEPWRIAIATLEAANNMPVVRMVFDESHFYFMEVDFRPEAFSKPAQLRRGPTQFLLLTATGNETACNFMRTEFALQRPVVISACSDRKELHLRIEYQETMDHMLIETQKALEIARNSTSSGWTARDRVLVFVNTLKDGLRAAEFLCATFYHAHSKDFPITDEKREEVYDNWVKGISSPILVCTSALSAGNDYRHVRVTVHLGVPRHYIQLHQQLGRAGRDGDPAWNVVLAYGRSRYTPEVDELTADYGDIRGAAFMERLVYGDRKTCTTALTTGFLDDRCASDAHERNQTAMQRLATHHPQALSNNLQEFSSASVNGRGQTGGIGRSQSGERRFQVILAASSSTPSTALVQRAAGPVVPATAGIKRALEDAFGAVSMEQRAAKRQAKDDRAVLIDKFKQYLRLLPHKNICGYCFAVGATKTNVHAPAKCMMMGPSRADLFSRFSVRFKEKITGKPCFTCLMHSLGGNELHADFREGHCDHPNLLSGLAFGIWCDSQRRKRVRTELQVTDSWHTIEQFAVWMGQRLPTGEWPSMALWRLFMDILRFA
ncbi:hypothetical protein C8F01DRAFT_1091383 [Mycena amicta]|nr:hypothetical protein C8F01DRAFT_1091383 [Mycena amicta]